MWKNHPVPNFDPYIAKCWDWTPMALCLYNVPSSYTVVNNCFVNAGGVSATGLVSTRKTILWQANFGMANLWRLNLCGFKWFQGFKHIFPRFLSDVWAWPTGPYWAYALCQSVQRVGHDLNLSISLHHVSFDYGRFNWTNSSVDKQGTPW